MKTRLRPARPQLDLRLHPLGGLGNVMFHAVEHSPSNVHRSTFTVQALEVLKIRICNKKVAETFGSLQLICYLCIGN